MQTYAAKGQECAIERGQVKPVQAKPPPPPPVPIKAPKQVKSFTENVSTIIFTGLPDAATWQSEIGCHASSAVLNPLTVCGPRNLMTHP